MYFYTKWKKDRISDDERNGFFKDIDKDTIKKRQMRREMRRFVRDLAVPLYFRFKYVQFHDTLNGIARVVYVRLHEKMVMERKEHIREKTRIGEFD